MYYKVDELTTEPRHPLYLPLMCYWYTVYNPVHYTSLSVCGRKEVYNDTRIQNRQMENMLDILVYKGLHYKQYYTWILV